ncbi:MAG: hypothetical protein ACREQI_08955 [Candidatus Binataceae bacterium]
MRILRSVCRRLGANSPIRVALAAAAILTLIGAASARAQDNWVAVNPTPTAATTPAAPNAPAKPKPKSKPTLSDAAPAACARHASFNLPAHDGTKLSCAVLD